MSYAVVFLFNAALSFALSLLLAGLLGPSGFGRFAVGLSIALVAATAAFEWLRLSASRYYSDRVRADNPSVRRTLDFLLTVSVFTLALCVVAALAVGTAGGLSPAVLLASAACALAFGLCEYHLALARARFLEGTFLGLTLLRSVGSLILAGGAALALADPAWTLAGTATATLLPVLLLRGRLADPYGPSTRVRPDLARAFARYGLPLVAANGLYLLLPLISRTVLAEREGFAAAGYLGLASELITRLFQNFGAGLDLALFQLAVRAEETHGPEAARAQASRNLAAIAAIAFPAASGLWLVWPAFEALFVPAAFQGHVAGTAGLLIPALVAYVLAQYGLSPLFQLRGTSLPAVAAGLVALAVHLGLVFGPFGLRGPEGFAAAQLGATTAAVLVLYGLAARLGLPLPWRDLVLAAAFSGIMAAALWPTRGLLGPLPTLLGQTAAGVALYAGLAWAADLAGVRRVAASLRGGPVRIRQPSSESRR